MPTSRSPKIVAAEEFRLVDSNGKVCAALHLHGGPTLELCDEDHGSRVTVKIEAGRPLINFALSGVEGVVGIGVSPKGSVGMQFSAPDGKMRFMLDVSPEGQARLTLLDRSGESIAWHAPPQQ
jgi:hypothetical protein